MMSVGSKRKAVSGIFPAKRWVAVTAYRLLLTAYSRSE
jgi:hypothetical protein